MSIIHFLNVKEGDCSWIQHNDGKISVIDVFNAKKDDRMQDAITSVLGEILSKNIESTYGIKENLNQKKYPVNPIKYLKEFGIDTIFRFILTHPELDHMGGIKDLFASFDILNFWDTENNREILDFNERPDLEEDWKFYKTLRDTKYENPKRLTLYSEARGQYFNIDEDKKSGGNGLYLLAPTEELIKEANESKEYNDCSYVLLYRTGDNKKIIFSGDSHDKTWNYILDNHKEDISEVDILIAPHHGRKSNRSYKFLDVLNPKITFFGNAKSEYLAYDEWNYRNLLYITNNMANCSIAEIINKNIKIYVTNENFARRFDNYSYSEEYKAYYIFTLN